MINYVLFQDVLNGIFELRNVLLYCRFILLTIVVNFMFAFRFISLRVKDNFMIYELFCILMIFTVSFPLQNPKHFKYLFDQSFFYDAGREWRARPLTILREKEWGVCGEWRVCEE